MNPEDIAEAAMRDRLIEHVLDRVAAGCAVADLRQLLVEHARRVPADFDKVRLALWRMVGITPPPVSPRSTPR